MNGLSPALIAKLPVHSHVPAGDEDALITQLGAPPGVDPLICSVTVCVIVPVGGVTARTLNTVIAPATGNVIDFSVELTIAADPI